MQSRERKLLAVSAVLFISMAGLLGAQRLIDWQKSLERQERNVELQEIEAEALLAEAPLWETRSEWMDAKQPKAANALEANRELDYLVNQAKEAGLTVDSQQLQEPVKTEWYYQTGATLVVRGKLPSVFRWMYGMLSPTEFRIVPFIKVTPDKDDPAQVMVAVQFWRRYAPEFTQGQ